MTAAEKREWEKETAYWYDSAQQNQETATGMFGNKHYDWSLYVFQLAIEKLLKGLIAATGVRPPYIHDLGRLAELAGIEVSEEHLDWLDVITNFNTAARYAEKKRELYLKATPEFTKLWHTRCQEIFDLLARKLAAEMKRSS